MNDAYRFVLTFYDAISTSTPHLYLSALALAPASSRLAQRARGIFASLITVAQGKETEWSPCLRIISVPSSVQSISLSPTTGHVVSGCSDGTIRIRDIATGDPVTPDLQGHLKPVTCVSYSPDGKRIISGSDDRTVRVWDAETGNCVFEPLQGHLDQVRCVG